MGIDKILGPNWTFTQYVSRRAASIEGKRAEALSYVKLQSENHSVVDRETKMNFLLWLSSVYHMLQDWIPQKLVKKRKYLKKKSKKNGIDLTIGVSIFDMEYLEEMKNNK